MKKFEQQWLSLLHELKTEIEGEKISKLTNEFVHVTYIPSSPTKVFDVITKLEIARQFWVHEKVSDWKPGSKWEHISIDGERKIQLAEQVAEFTPNKKLVLTLANAPEYEDETKQSRVTFDIQTFEDMVRLIVTHNELNAGSIMAVANENGWPHVLCSLKSFLESGKPIDLFRGAKIGTKTSILKHTANWPI